MLSKQISKYNNIRNNNTKNENLGIGLFHRKLKHEMIKNFKSKNIQISFN